MSKQPIPHTIRLQHGPLKLGLLHGHQLVPYQDEQVLLQTARQMEVDILIYGHVHQCGVKERDGLLLVNPGSATGALCTATASENTTPSFILMDVQGAHVTVYVYQEIGVEVKVEKLEYQKPGS